MKPFIQCLTKEEEFSFVARTFSTPHYEVGWHHHNEIELILFLDGDGIALVGNYIGSFKKGDIFFVGSNLPHTFRKRDPSLFTSALVVQFNEDFWGKDFLGLPEVRRLSQLFQSSKRGYQLSVDMCRLIEPLLRQLENASGIKRISLLFEVLSCIEDTREMLPLSSQTFVNLDEKNKIRLNKIIQFSLDSFREPMSLQKVANLAQLSIPAFCNYFKMCTHKTYICFLNEIKIGHACKLLIESRLNVSEICYESGFNTVANFNKQFRQTKNTTPSEFRKVHTNLH